MPMTVYIGREIAGDPCREAVALAHETKHVAVYRDELPRIAADVRVRLQSHLRTTTGFFITACRAQAARREAQAALGAEIGPLLEADHTTASGSVSARSTAP